MTEPDSPTQTLVDTGTDKGLAKLTSHGEDGGRGSMEQESSTSLHRVQAAVARDTVLSLASELPVPVASVLKLAMYAVARSTQRDEQFFLLKEALVSLMEDCAELSSLTRDGEYMSRRFEHLFQVISSTVREHATAMDAFTRQSSISRTLNSDKQKEKLTSMTSKLDTLRVQLGALLTAQTALAVRDIGKRLDELAARNASLETLLQNMARTGPGVSDGGKQDESIQLPRDQVAVDTVTGRNVSVELSDLTRTLNEKLDVLISRGPAPEVAGPATDSANYEERIAHIEALTVSMDAGALGRRVEAMEQSVAFRVGELVSTSKEKLEKANEIVSKVQELAEPWDDTKSLVADLLAPAREIMNLLDAVAEIHPAIKVVTGVVKVVIQMELQRHENDKQVAVVYFTMVNLLYLLSDLDPIFGDDKHLRHDQLQKVVEDIAETIKAFGSFCEVYYAQYTILKTLRSATWKEKLAGFASKFTEHKDALRELLLAQSALTTRDVHMDVKKAITLLQMRSGAEMKMDVLLDSMNGLSEIVKSDARIDELAERLDVSLGVSLRQLLREDLDDIVYKNYEVFSRKIEDATTGFDMPLDLIAVETHFEEALVDLTQASEPHQHIDDEDIRAIWRERKFRISAKITDFLEALYDYFLYQFAIYEAEAGQRHSDAWTLYFLSSPTYYPAICDAMGQSSSEYISAREINDFVHSKPSAMGCSTVAWIAFWALGPSITSAEHYRRVKARLQGLRTAPERALPQNTARVRYFAGVAVDLSLIRVHEVDLSYIRDDVHGKKAFRALEDLRAVWRDLETQGMKASLEAMKFQLKSPEHVSLALEGRRLEHCMMSFIDLLLSRHMQIVERARTQTVSIAEFVDMRNSWTQVFVAFGKRLDALEGVWRQQRLNVQEHVRYFSGGLFADWYERKQALLIQDTLDAGAMDDDLVTTALDDDDLLLFPVPEHPEDDSIPTENTSDWEPYAVRRYKAEIDTKTRLAGLESKLSVVNTTFSALDAKLSAVDAKFPILEARFPALEAKFPVLEAKTSAVDEKLSAVDAKLSSILSLLTQSH